MIRPVRLGNPPRLPNELLDMMIPILPIRVIAKIISTTNRINHLRVLSAGSVYNVPLIWGTHHKCPTLI